MKKRSSRRIWHLLSGMLALFLFTALPAFAEEYKGRVGGEGKTRSVEQLIDFLEKPGLQEKKQPERVLDLLGVKEGEVVADIGAGTGLFTFHLAPRVGPAGKVYAVDIEDRMLDFIRQKANEIGAKNIILVKSSAPSPNLPPACCDKIVMAGVYYFLSDRVAFMGNLRQALKPGGILAVIDLDLEKAAEKKPNNKFRLSRTETAEEIKRAGFELVESHDFLAERFFLVFRAAD